MWVAPAFAAFSAASGLAFPTPLEEESPPITEVPTTSPTKEHPVTIRSSASFTFAADLTLDRTILQEALRNKW